MRIVFLGTPSFAVTTLQKLAAWENGKVAAVVTQPDRPAGRGNRVQISPVKNLALSLGIPILQPKNFSKEPEMVEQLRALKPDVLVMVAFGQILKAPVLELAPYGVINLHASMLPRYRGPAPINWAILNGDTTTGITTTISNAGIDTGKVLLQKEIPIGHDQTAIDLSQSMADAGADLMLATLEGLRAKSITPQAQDESKATYAPLLTRETGRIDWTKSSAAIHNLVRGLLPWPGAYSHLNNTMIKIVQTARPRDLDLGEFILPARWGPGLFIRCGDRMFVNCGTDNQPDLLQLLVVQPESRSRMTVAAYVNGLKLEDAVVIGTFTR